MNWRIFSLWSFVMVVMTFLGLIMGGLLGCWIISGTTPSFVSFLFRWQELLGSLIGAAAGALVAVGAIYLNKYLQAEEQRRRYLSLMEKQLLLAIGNVLDIDSTLHNFKEMVIKELKKGIREDIKIPSYSTREAFVPLFSTLVIEADGLRESTGSGYVDTQLLTAVGMSKNFALMMEDVRRQFDRTISKNSEMGSQRLNPLQYHNEMFLKNIENFDEYLRKHIFRNNIPGYLRQLESTIVPLQKLIILKRGGWRREFGVRSLTPEVRAEIDEYFKEEIDSRLRALKKEVKSEVVLVGEKLPTS